MNTLNYHHLRYFREVAHEGNLSRAAEKLNIAQSALSIQIKNLEARLGHALFERVGRGLVLTEIGRITLDHADQIFSTGEELLATLDQSGTKSPPLRVGSLSTLSRNFQMAFLRPAFLRSNPANDTLEIILKSGNTTTLLEALKTLSLDVILTTELPAHEEGSDYAAQRISEQVVGVHGLQAFMSYKTLPEILEKSPIILPTDNAIRSGFLNLAAKLGIAPRIAANVDDMAMVRLLAREGAGVAIAPAVVFADEIQSGKIITAPFELGISQPFYAVTIARKYSHPMLQELLSALSG